MNTKRPFLSILFLTMPPLALLAPATCFNSTAIYGSTAWNPSILEEYKVDFYFLYFFDNESSFQSFSQWARKEPERIGIVLHFPRIFAAPPSVFELANRSSQSYQKLREKAWETIERCYSIGIRTFILGDEFPYSVTNNSIAALQSAAQAYLRETGRPIPNLSSPAEEKNLFGEWFYGKCADAIDLLAQDIRLRADEGGLSGLKLGLNLEAYRWSNLTEPDVSRWSRMDFDRIDFDSFDLLTCHGGYDLIDVSNYGDPEEWIAAGPKESGKLPLALAAITRLPRDKRTFVILAAHNNMGYTATPAQMVLDYLLAQELDLYGVAWFAFDQVARPWTASYAINQPDNPSPLKTERMDTLNQLASISHETLFNRMEGLASALDRSLGILRNDTTARIGELLVELQSLQSNLSNQLKQVASLTNRSLSELRDSTTLTFLALEDGMNRTHRRMELLLADLTRLNRSMSSYLLGLNESVTDRISDSFLQLSKRIDATGSLLSEMLDALRQSFNSSSRTQEAQLNRLSAWAEGASDQLESDHMLLEELSKTLLAIEASQNASRQGVDGLRSEIRQNTYLVLSVVLGAIVFSELLLITLFSRWRG